MDRSDVHVRDLRRLEISAWDAVLSQHSEMDGIAVTAVAEEPLPERRHTRYLLSLAGHSDPVPLWATETTPTEVAFYRDVGPSIPRLLARCWWHDEGAVRGWRRPARGACCPPPNRR